MLVGQRTQQFTLFMTPLVRQFDPTSSLESVLPLLKFAEATCDSHSQFDTSRSVICTLLKELEERLLLDSEPTLHLWAVAKYVKNMEIDQAEPQDEWFEKALNKMESLESALFVHYQKYVEDPDKKKLEFLHQLNINLYLIVDDFVAWYFNGDLIRTNHLYAAIRSDVNAAESNFLRQMQVEILPATFECFRFFNEVAQKFKAVCWKLTTETLVMDLESYSAPDCVCLVHLSSFFDRQLRLVNKFYGTSLCLVDGQVLCCDSQDDGQQMCVAKVDSDTALTTFSYETRDTSCWKLAASDPSGIVKVATGGTEWKLMAVDEQHVKIFTEDGKNTYFFTIFNIFNLGANLIKNMK